MGVESVNTICKIKAFIKLSVTQNLMIVYKDRIDLNLRSDFLLYSSQIRSVQLICLHLSLHIHEYALYFKKVYCYHCTIVYHNKDK